jgi:hypothetical protein
MRLIAIAVVAAAATACTYGPNASTFQTNNYPPVGYVLHAQPASQQVCGVGYQAQYQTFWTYDPQGRFNPTQQYVCAPSQRR